MSYLRFCIFFPLVCLCSLQATMYHHNLDDIKNYAKVYEWQQEETSSFDELLISWNAARPKTGYYTIYVSVKQETWTPWLLYAHWGQDFQEGTKTRYEGCPVRVSADAVIVPEESKSQAFRILVLAQEGAELENFAALHVCATEKGQSFNSKLDPATKSVDLSVPSVPQLAAGEMGRRLCSPSSTLAIVRYFTEESTVEQLTFAMQAHDSYFDIFGNWVLNTSAAYPYLPNGVSCWVEKLFSVDALIAKLHSGCPVVISVRPPLRHSELPPEVTGHLIVVKGYDATTQEFLCMDPYSPAEDTFKRYHIEDLLTAWEKREHVAYIFHKAPDTTEN